jgi:DNA-directed RNA polymerase specialized sigma24 family protein
MEQRRYHSVIVAIQEARTAETVGSSLVALQRLARAADEFTDLVSDLSLQAAREGFTQRAIARALDVPEHTLRGLAAEAKATR